MRYLVQMSITYSCEQVFSCLVDIKLKRKENEKKQDKQGWIKPPGTGKTPVTGQKMKVTLNIKKKV